MTETSPTSQKAASDANEPVPSSENYLSRAPQDVYRTQSTTAQAPPNTEPPSSEGRQSYIVRELQDPYSAANSHGRLAYGYQQPHEYTSRSSSFTTLPALPSLPPPPQSLPPISLPNRPSTSYPTTPNFSPTATRTSRASPGDTETQIFTMSPRELRRARGHVVSACVPCKRAHLRCDSHRPCSRCVGSGKEDSCHDVVHKKRGRPRLREDHRDREPRFDLTRPPPPHDSTALRRPAIYPSSLSPGTSTGQLSPSNIFASRPSATIHHSSVYDIPTANAIAYLTMDFEIVRLSDLFVGFIGELRNRRSLMDFVIPGERGKLMDLRNMFHAEQKHKEPNYLPPILNRGEKIIMGLTFAHVRHYHLSHHDYFHIVALDGMPHMVPIEMGLAKVESCYFIILRLDSLPRLTYQPSSPHEREMAVSHNQPSAMAHGFYSQGQHNDRRMSDSPLAVYTQSGQAHQTISNRISGPPTLSYSAPSYSASSNRPGYSASSSYQTPRSELPNSQSPFSTAYQLPPIRAQLHNGRDEPTTRGQAWHYHSDRSGRVDIDGLLDKPEGPERQH